MDYGKILIKVFDNSNDTLDRFILSVRNELQYTPQMVSDDELRGIWNSSQNALDSRVRSSSSLGRSSGRGFSNFLTEVVQSQQTQRPLGNYDQRDLSTLIDFVTPQGNVDIGSIASELANKSSELFQSEIIRNLRIEADLRRSINEDIGLTGELSEGLRRDIRMATTDAILYGYGVKEVTDMVVRLMDETGRFNMISEETMAGAAPVARAFVGSLSEMGRIMSQFQNIGIGFDNTINLIEDIGVRSTALGLSARGTVRDINENLDRINEYGFRNGVEGLAEMSRRSREFRMNMQNVFAVADRVFSPEGAIDLAANLQVLGGAVGDFNDPLRLMYMATNNVEGLQDALIGAASSLATYNEEQGRFEITGVNLRIAKEMANTLGISLGDLSRTAIASAERVDASMALLSSGLDLDEDEQRFLTNLSRMEGGQMIISLPKNIAEEMGLDTTRIALSDMSEDLKDRLIEQQKRFEGMDARDLAMEQVTSLENINRRVNSILEIMSVGTTNLVSDYTEFMGGNRLGREAVQVLENTRQSTRGAVNNISRVLSPEQMFPNYVESQSVKDRRERLEQTNTTTETKNVNIRISSDTKGDWWKRFIERRGFNTFLDDTVIEN